MVRRLHRIVRNTTLPALLLGLLATGPAPSPAQAARAGKLVVNVTGFHNADGNLLLYVRSDSTTAVAARTIQIDAKSMTVQAVFDSLPEGTYGVSAIHDANKNGQLDFNDMGMPVEGYGHSNNPARRMGPPDFNETKFTLGKAVVTIDIALIYWP